MDVYLVEGPPAREHEQAGQHADFHLRRRRQSHLENRKRRDHDVHLRRRQGHARKNGTDTIHYRYDTNGTLLSMNLNGTEYYYLYNGQRDVIGLYDANGNVVVEYT